MGVDSGKGCHTDRPLGLLAVGSALLYAGTAVSMNFVNKATLRVSIHARNTRLMLDMDRWLQAALFFLLRLSFFAGRFASTGVPFGLDSINLSDDLYCDDGRSALGIWCREVSSSVD